jgi:peptidoglycan/xylan/chitin deacetylase (PgdA/CDA1 family)
MGAFFIVSIDTELKWGYRFYPATKMARVLQDREEEAISCIGAFLDLFEKYSVPATWAVVGKLFYEHPELLASIRESGIEHEIGYHSFSHIRFSQVSRATAEKELKEGLKIQDEFGVRFRSFVFPENMIGHVDLLREYGFSIYRGPNNAGASVNKSLPVRAKNFALFRIVAPPVEPHWKDTIWEIPSSMQFHDVSFFQKLLTFKAKQGIKKAMEAGCTFHMFLHPENALIDPKLLDRLEKVLQFVKTEAEKKELLPVTMGDFVEVITHNRLGRGTSE